jgi:hypothetical protein
MKKYYKYLFVACIVVGIMFCACGDDDDECPACPQQLTNPPGFTNGTFYLNPEAYMEYFYIYGFGAVPPNIDSVKIGDSLVNVDDIFYSYNADYADGYWEIYFDEDGNASTYMYDHGDTAVVVVYGEGLSSTCRLIILNALTAEANITSPAYDADTITAADSDTIYWNEVEHADYYAILLEFRDYANGSIDWYYRFDYSLDTSFIVTPEMYPDSLNYFYVDVTPFTGPDPRTGQTNWTGNLLGGKLYSLGWDDYVRIYGWNIPPAPAGKLSVEENRKEWTPAEIVKSVYDQFK